MRRRTFTMTATLTMMWRCRLMRLYKFGRQRPDRSVSTTWTKTPSLHQDTDPLHNCNLLKTLTTNYSEQFCTMPNTSSTVCYRCKKTFFYVFYSGHVFTFLTFFFIFPTFFIFKNVHWKYRLKSLSKQRKQIGSIWLFFFVPMLEFPYRPIYWQALLYTYHIGLHQMTPL